MSEKPLSFSTTKVNKIAQCPGSEYKKFNTTYTPNSNLQRWKSINDAIIDWLVNQAPDEVAINQAEENNFKYFDKLQQKISSELFSQFRNIYHKNTADLNADFPSSSISKFINDEEVFINAHTQFEFEDEVSTEYVKLKTGKKGVSDLDKAIILKTRLENETFYVADLYNNDLLEISSIENADEVIDDNFLLLEGFINENIKLIPGNHCTLCERSSSCGEYPSINGEATKKSYRGIVISKTNLLNKDNCERQFAWKTQYGIPKEEKESDPFPMKVGISFHKFSGMMLLNTKDYQKSGEIERLKNLLKEEDGEVAIEVIKKYEQLLNQIKDFNNLEITARERVLGFTAITDAIVQNKSHKVYEGKIAATFMGSADLVGRLDGAPLVVELKTGAQLPQHSAEAELYALGAFIQTKEKEVVVLHIYVSDKEEKIVERRFTDDQIEALKKKFDSIAKTIGQWDPSDALQPGFSEGDWCNFCDFQTTCLEFR